MGSKLLQIEELKSLVEELAEEHEILKEPFYLYMWLRYCDFRVTAAATAIKESFKWREELLATPINDLEPPKELTMTLDERTKDGAPLICIDLGEIDPKKDLSDLGYDHCYRIAVNNTLKMEKLIVEHGKKLLEGSKLSDTDLENSFKKAIILINVASVTFSQVRSWQVLKFALDVATGFIKHFPGVASHIISVKASRSFAMVFNVIEPILRSKVKLEVHASGSEKWLEKLQDDVTVSQIPVSFGGKKIVPRDIVAWQARRKNLSG